MLIDLQTDQIQAEDFIAHPYDDQIAGNCRNPGPADSPTYLMSKRHALKCHITVEL